LAAARAAGNLEKLVAGRSEPATLVQNSLSLALTRAAPHTVVDTIFQCVFEAGGRYGALCADTPSPVDAGAIMGEERGGREVAAQAHGHPRILFCIVDHGLFPSDGLPTVEQLELSLACENPEDLM
jgi:hypothetical protein